ncbi:hypothetical protein PLIIFM63780_010048 [Purpureocillium lilacinum]|nr:hypothetical protein PLIIFM63780_010048 [Purpureocillium lilacinum]
MSFFVAKTEQLASEVRLAAAISEFEASLDPERKAALRNHRSKYCESLPSIQDVMQITAEFNQISNSQKPGSRCWGTRLTNFLEAVQQYAAVGDVIVGGSQNIIACGSVVATSSRIGEVTAFFMQVGLSAPRYDRLALLFPQSKRLVSCMSEYYIVVVRFCHQLAMMQKKSAIQQLVSFTDDLSLKAIRKDLDTWAASIKEEIETLKTEEQTSHLRQLMRSSDSESHRRKLKTNLRVLRMCSNYDYKASWKKLRKVGASTLFRQSPQYLDWLQQKGPPTLLCRGRLGSGKSVCLASIVDDLNLVQRDEGIPVAFFFCRHDIKESLQMHTVIASLAYQLLRGFSDLSSCLEIVDSTAEDLELSDIMNMLMRAKPRDFVARFVLDGLDECDESKRRDILDLLYFLQSKFTLLVCISLREGSENLSLKDSNIFNNSSVFVIPEENPDIYSFIESELERRLECRSLNIGRPELILEIQSSLSTKAKGMFLWVALQIDSLCAARTDEAIRQALADLPGDLPETYLRILKKSASAAPEYQTLILKLILSARRPMTGDEFREALSVKPGDATWHPVHVINNVNSVLACCGSLVSVDEETSTVELIHGSVKQFLNGNFAKWDDRYVKLAPNAETTMADIVITYLNYGVFESQISTAVVPTVESAEMPSKIIRSIDSAVMVRNVALRLLRNKNRPKASYDLGKMLHNLQGEVAHENPFSFYDYAKTFWARHIWRTSLGNAAIQSLQVKLLRREIASMKAGDARVQRLFLLATSRDYHTDDIFQALIDIGAQTEAATADGHTPLTLAAARGSVGTLKRLLEMGVEVETKSEVGLTALSWASKNGFFLAVELLLQHHAKVDTTCRLGREPLAWAASNQADPQLVPGRAGEYAKVVRLLIDNGAEVDAKCTMGNTALSLAALHGDASVARVLVEKGADWTSTNRAGMSALLNMVTWRNMDVLRVFIEMAEPAFFDIWGQRLLLSASENGWREAADMLVNAGIQVKT